MLALLSGGWLVHPPRSLFDNAPLWELLRTNLNFDGIPRGLYKEHLHAVGICATSYRGRGFGDLLRLLVRRSSRGRARCARARACT